MNNYIQKWLLLNWELCSLCDKLCEALKSRIEEDAFIKISHMFLLKSTRTLKGVCLLYDNNLEEQAQALVRILIELRLSFDCFLKMANKDVKSTCERILDSMMLEKVKQARASGFAGIDSKLRDSLERTEREITSRYTPQELKALKTHGFTGLSVEQRAKITGNEGAYDIVYRNFSRNIHSSDYLEHCVLQETDRFLGYVESRDIVSMYATHFSAAGIAEFANAIFRCGFDEELMDIGKKQEELKSTRPTVT